MSSSNKNLPEFIRSLYRGARPNDEMNALGEAYRPPVEFGHMTEHLVAKLKKLPDGYDVEVYELRAPARFFRIVALPTTGYEGKPKPGFEISTGSGMGAFVAEAAKLITQGMLTIRET